MRRDEEFLLGSAEKRGHVKGRERADTRRETTDTRRRRNRVKEGIFVTSAEEREDMSQEEVPETEPTSDET